MLGDPGGVRHGTSGPPNNLHILGQSSDGVSRRGILRGSISSFGGGCPRGDRYPPLISIWWWTQWCVAGSHWCQEAWEGSAVGEGRCHTVKPFSTRVTSWSYQQTWSGFRGRLTPSPSCSTGWVFGQTSVIRSGFSDSYDYYRQMTGEGLTYQSW